MRRLIVTLLLLGTLVTVSAYSQNLEDVVYLKNGSIIRGTITEMFPKEPIKIQMRDGSIFVYELDDILKIVKEPRQLTASSPLNSGTMRGQLPSNQLQSLLSPELKNPAFATGLSFLVSGLGQLYLNEGKRGAGYFITSFVGWALYFGYTNDSGEINSVGTMGAALAIFSWLCSMYDAYTGANRINQEYRQRLQGKHLIEFNSRWANDVGIDPITTQDKLGVRLTLHW